MTSDVAEAFFPRPKQGRGSKLKAVSLMGEETQDNITNAQGEAKEGQENAEVRQRPFIF